MTSERTSRASRLADRLVLQGGEGGHPHQRAVELAHVGADVRGDELGHLVRQLDLLEVGLPLQDGGAGLELRHVDLDPHAPLEAGAEPVLQPLQLLGAAVAGEDDLDVLLVERVEGVEELLRRLLLARQELHVVHEQRGALAVLLAELVERALAQGVHEVVGVALGGDHRDPAAGAGRQDGVADRVEQVGLAEAGVAVDEERVPGVARLLGHRVGGGEGEAVRLADHEGLEDVARARAGVARRRGGRGGEPPGRRGPRAAGLGLARPVVHHEDHPGRAAGHLRQELLEPSPVVVVHEVAVELVRRGHVEPLRRPWRRARRLANQRS